MTSIVTKKETVKKIRQAQSDLLGTSVNVRKNIRKKVVKRWYSQNNTITNSDLIAMAREHNCMNGDEILWNKLREVNAE
tara:strand:- start:12 stop:248 length:237 start_codon:yes stop_codon:yes gene_type:complete